MQLGDTTVWSSPRWGTLYYPSWGVNVSLSDGKVTAVEPCTFP
jgi:hypothetical protein